MDQDINFQHRAAFATSAKTTFFAVPYRCTLRNVIGIVQADPGDAQTVTVSGGDDASTATTELGVLTFGTDIAAGAIGEWAPDADSGNTILEEGAVLKFVTSVGTAANLDLNIELDPYAR